MNQTQLIIYDNASGIVQYEVDLYDNEPIQLTKQIFDVENPDERVADFSRTIKLPGTHTNNQIFGHFFDLNRFTINDTLINFNDDFNATLKANALLYFNNVLQSRGSLQLTNVINLPDGGCEYEVVFIGEVKNLFQDVSEKKLNELDLSAYDHTLDRDTIVDSWTAGQANGYVYPLIDYGFDNNQYDFRVEHFRPAIYVKTLVDKVFSEAGYTYSSNFLTSDFFKSMILPCSGDFNFSEQQVEDRTGTYDVSGSPTVSTYDIRFFNDDWFKVPFNTVIKDTDPTGYNTTNYVYIFDATTAGTYTISKCFFNFELTNGPLPFGAPSLIHLFRIRFILEKPSGDTITIGIIDQSEDLPASTTSTIFMSLNQSIEFKAQSGDKVYAIFSKPIWTNFLQWRIPYSITILPSTTFTLKTTPQGAFEGAPVSLTATINKDIKQSEFLVWLVKMFNLYIESDQFDERKLLIEPRNDYYVSGTVDWTNKVDYNSEIRIKPVSLSKYNQYTFQYTEDDDFWNKTYKPNSEYTYGHRTFEVINLFTEETKEVQVGFAPTPLSRWQYQNLPISVIKFVNDDGNRQVKSAKPRLLFYKRYLRTDTPIPWRLISISNGTESIYDYPYAGHLDDFDNPQFDLNWGLPGVIYFDPVGGLLTNANLFNTYWIDYIRSITDPDSKVVEMMLHLNEVDINNLSFRKRYLIDRQYYILHNIEYDLVDNGLAKCTFLKLVGKYNYQTGQSTVNGGTGEWPEGDIQIGGQGENKPLFAAGYTVNNNQYDTQRKAYTANTFITGRDNFIAGGGFVSGERNQLTSENAVVFNSNDCDVALERVTLINASGYTPSLEGEAVIQDVQFPFCKRVILTEAQIDALHTTRIELVPDASGFIVEYVDAYAVNRFGTTAYAGHKIFIANTSGGENVAEFAATFSSASETCLQKANKIDQPLFTEGGLELYAGNNLNGGNGEFEFVVQYRLIKI